MRGESKHSALHCLNQIQM